MLARITISSLSLYSVIGDFLMILRLLKIRFSNREQDKQKENILYDLIK